MPQHFNQYNNEAAQAAAHARWMTSPEGLANQQQNLAKEAYFAYDPASGIPEDAFTQDFISKRIITGPPQTQYERTGKLDLSALENLQGVDTNAIKTAIQKSGVNNNNNNNNRANLRMLDNNAGMDNMFNPGSWGANTNSWKDNIKAKMQSLGVFLPQGTTFKGNGFRFNNKDGNLDVTGSGGGIKAMYTDKF